MAQLLQKLRKSSSMARHLNQPAQEVTLPQKEEAPVAPQKQLRVVQKERPVVEVKPVAVIEKLPEPEVVEEVKVVHMPEPIPAPLQVQQTKQVALPRKAGTKLDSIELYLTPNVKDFLDELMLTFKSSVSRGIGTNHILRGILSALGEHLPEIKENVAALGELKRPSNNPEAFEEREYFERQLGEAVVKALRG